MHILQGFMDGILKPQEWADILSPVDFYLSPEVLTGGFKSWECPSQPSQKGTSVMNN